MYDCSCEDCQTQKQTLNLSNSSSFKNLLKTAEKAFKKLYNNKGYSPNDLSDTKEYQDLINQTNAIFDKTIVDNVVDGALLKNLQNDVFLFSGLKTHAQLLEASRLLLDADKKIKPLAQFTKNFLKINETYNRQYLEAEYQFAVGSATVAQRWSTFSDDENRYYLQYRTDGGPHVRDSHAALNNTTLPKSDPFWDSYTPQNGWNCHCMVTEVLAWRHEKSDSKKAIARGETATTQIGKDSKNKLAIFRFNPGKDKVIFPPTHPYSKLVGANVVKEVLNSNKPNENTFVPKEIVGYEKE